MRSEDSVSRIEVTIVNTQGLHARPVMRFVDIASQFKCDIRVKKGEVDVDGKSPMEMMLLEAIKGTTLTLEACGDGAAKALEQLAELVNNGFGEQ